MRKYTTYRICFVALMNREQGFLRRLRPSKEIEQFLTLKKWDKLLLHITTHSLTEYRANACRIE